MNGKKVFSYACLLIAVGIILGAFAAHGLKEKISSDKLEVFEKGVRYHLLHALALMVVGLNFSAFLVSRVKLAVVLMFLGILFFSGSLYLLATTEINGMAHLKSVIGPITPIGGLCFIGSWVVLAFALKNNE